MDKKRARQSGRRALVRPFTAISPRAERNVQLTPAKRLEVEESVMKPEIRGPTQIPIGGHPISQSAVGFEDANKQAAKESVRPPLQQAWESPSMSPKKMSTGIPPFSPGHKRGMKKVQDFLYPDHLSKLRQKFQASEGSDELKKGYLDLDGFIEFFRSLPELRGKSNQEIRIFFEKIDCFSEGQVNWDDFCTFMYLELYERHDAQTKAKEVCISTPANLIGGPHKDSLCKICGLTDGTFVSCSQDGIICVWGHDFEQKRVRKTEVGILGKPKWISDMALDTRHGKIILSTGDNEIQFFEMINFEPYCQLSNFESTPLKIDFWFNPDNHIECMLLVGDEQGTVTILKIPNVYDAFKNWKLGPKKNGMPNYGIERLVMSEPVAGIKVYRWKLHSNWVSDVRYFGALRVFISCSADSVCSLAMGTPSGSTPVESILRGNFLHRPSVPAPEMCGRAAAIPAKSRIAGDQRVLKVNKGVNSFDYCQKNNVLVTGGMDQVIRIWNPFVTSRPVGQLYGQDSPIFCVKIDSHNNRIYCISNDNTVKVWDLVEQNCLATIIAAAHKIFPPVEAIFLNTLRQYVVIGTEQLSVLHLTGHGNLPQSNFTFSHRLPVTAVAYSRSFELVITACEGSVVKVWDLITGEIVFEFASVHGKSKIAALSLDSSGRRLATAGENGELKLWNFNNGHCLLTLDKGNKEEVTDVKFVSVNQIKYIIAVGWDRRINVFSDMLDSGVKTVIHPIESWTKATAKAHKEDILCLAFCPPQLLATASFGGEIILWSMITGQIVQKLNAPTPKRLKICKEEGDCAIYKLLFLEGRKSNASTFLVSSGPAGYAYFWKIHRISHLMGAFPVTQTKCLMDIVSDAGNSCLYAADREGFIHLWNIQCYCYDYGTGSPSPKCVMKWRAHATAISRLVFVEQWQVLISASIDCSVRVWTQDGKHIGTFGQEKPWQLGMSSTYQHPMTPKDVLLDPMTLPAMTSTDSTLDTRTHIDSVQPRATGEKEMNEESNEDILARYGLSVKVPSKDSAGTRQPGKRLRHLRTNSAKTAGGYKPPTGSYASLLYQDLTEDIVISRNTNRQY